MSKELEALERINEIVLPYSEAKQGYLRPRDVCPNEFSIIETALKDYENLQLKHSSMQDVVLDDFKKIKALEIIKEKNVSIVWLKNCKDRSEYNDLADKEEQLTQEEYELLKEVLR